MPPLYSKYLQLNPFPIPLKTKAAAAAAAANVNARLSNYGLGVGFGLCCEVENLSGALDMVYMDLLYTGVASALPAEPATRSGGKEGQGQRDHEKISVVDEAEAAQEEDRKRADLQQALTAFRPLTREELVEVAMNHPLLKPHVSALPLKSEFWNALADIHAVIDLFFLPVRSQLQHRN